MGLTLFERIQYGLLRRLRLGQCAMSVTWPPRWEWGAEREYWTRYLVGPIFVLRYRRAAADETESDDEP